MPNSEEGERGRVGQGPKMRGGEPGCTQVLSILKVQGKFNSDSNGADTTYICKHFACLHTQKCAHNFSSQITLVSQQGVNLILV